MTENLSGSDRTFTTADGLKLHLKPVRRNALTLLQAVVEREYRERHEMIDPPTYTITTVAGEKETYDLTETTLEDPKDPEQTRLNTLRWAKYQEVRRKANAEIRERQNTMMFCLGVEFAMSEDDGWVEQFEWAKIPIPTDERSRRGYYLLNVALSDSEQAEVMMRLNMLSAGDVVTEADKAAILSTFRHQMGQRVRDAVGAVERTEGAVVGEQQAERGVAGDQVGDDTGGVGQPTKRRKSRDAGG